jgi:hypothetical protein
MDDSEFVEVAHFRNGKKVDVRMYLEMIGDELILPPGYEIDLLARPSPNLLPIYVVCWEDGLQIYPFREPDPDWHFRFEGSIYSAGSREPTNLAKLKAKSSREPEEPTDSSGS